MHFGRRSWVSTCFHPVLLGTSCFLLILYKAFPSTFAFLINALPVIICAALLLGIILVYGEPNIPQVDEKERRTLETSTQKHTPANNLTAKDDGGCKIVNTEEDKKPVRALPVEGTTLFHRRTNNTNETVDGVVYIKSEREVEQMPASIVNQSSLHEKDHKEKCSTKGSLQVKVTKPSPKSCNDKCQCHSTESDQKPIKYPSFNSGRHAGHGHTSLREAWDCIDNEEASSDAETDAGETYGISVTDVLPTLDELDPLVTKDNSDVSSVVSSIDNNSNCGTLDEETENLDDEDDEETQEEKDESNKVPVTWTADDQRNLVDLGNSELERNRRLENLLAKRRARQILRYEMEKNLIDLEGNDSLPSIEELQRFQVQLPAVYAPRRNPFDFPFDAEEIPGSAPSFLRRNPFDIPFEQVEQNSNIGVENLNRQEPMVVPPRDFMFRRHESFNVGPSFFGDFRRTSRVRPFFVTERMESMDTEFTDLHRQLNEMSDSKMSSVAESDAVSSIADQEQDGNMNDDTESHGEIDAELAEKESKSSEEVDSLEVEQVESAESIDDDHENRLGNDMVAESSYQVPESFREADDNTSEEMELSLHISDNEKVEVIDEEYDSGSSSPSEADEKSSETSIQEVLNDPEPEKLDDSVNADPDIVEGRVENVLDNQAVGPVFDSSPTASQRSFSNLSSLDEASFKAENDDLVVKYLTEPEVHASEPDLKSNASELDSPHETPLSNIPVEKDAEEEQPLNSGTGWVASSSLAAVDEIESASKEVTMIGERDVLGDELTKVHEDFGSSIEPILPDPEAMKSMLQPSFSAEIGTSESS